MDEYLPGPLGVIQRKMAEQLGEHAAMLREGLLDALVGHEHDSLVERVNGHTTTLAAIDERLDAIEDRAGQNHDGLDEHLAEIERRLAALEKPPAKPRPSRAKPKPADAAKGRK